MANEQSIRDYRLTDPEMYDAAKTKRDFFEEDKADFVAFDADFADPYSADWETLIGEAEAIPQDENLDDQLTQLTAAVEVQMGKCRDKFQDSKFFIEKAFPNNAPVWNEFGYDNYLDARRKQLLMINFMTNFYEVATKYHTELIAKGYLQTKIDEIDARRSDLNKANRKQEAFIGNLPVLTQARHEKNNAVWTIVSNVCAAGKRIYKDNFGKYQRYLLPEGSGTTEEKSIFGLVTDDNGGAPLKDVNILIQELSQNIKTKASGRFAIGGLADGTYTLVFSLTDYVSQTKTVAIVDGAAVEVNVQMVHV